MQVQSGKYIQQKVRYLAILGVLLISISSCQFRYRIPKDFPKEDEFAQILADIHFVESVVSQNQVRSRNGGGEVNRYYNSALAKHNLTQEKFDTIVSWYSSHPELYQEVYEKTITILSENEAHWQSEVKEIKEEMERIRKIKEARNVWNDEREMILVSSKDTFDRRIPFDFLVDTISESGYRISAFYQFLSGNMVKKPNMQVVTLFSDSTLDTINYSIPATFSNRKIEFNIDVKDSLHILRLYGFLLMHDTNEVVKARIRNVEFEYIPQNDTVLNELDDPSLVK